MIPTIKRLLYRSLSLENYLRLLQRSYFVLYRCGALRLSSQYGFGWKGACRGASPYITPY